MEVFKTRLNKPSSDKVCYLLWHFFEQIGLDNLQRFLPIWIGQWSCMVIANLRLCFLRSHWFSNAFLDSYKGVPCMLYIKWLDTCLPLDILLEWLTPSLSCSLHEKLFWMRCLNIPDASPEYLKLYSSGELFRVSISISEVSH